MLHGEEPATTATDLRRIAGVAGIRNDHPLFKGLADRLRALHTPGTRLRQRPLRTGDGPVDRHGLARARPRRPKEIIDYGIHSLIAAPIQAGGVVLGVANFWRAKQHRP